MATTNDRSQANALTESLAAWTNLLATESDRLSALGLRAGILSIDVEPDDSASTPAALACSRILQLFRHAIGSSDRYAQTSETKISVLHAPVTSLVHLYAQAWHIANMLERAGIEAAVGFAHRRPDESLLDTWARADAQADRIQFRKHRTNGGLSLR